MQHEFSILFQPINDLIVKIQQQSCVTGKNASTPRYGVGRTSETQDMRIDTVTDPRRRE